MLQDYPYGILDDGVTARVIAVFTAAKVPVLRGDWFVATASRPPLYQDILQLPGNLAELERQLRVDAGLNITQERVMRVAFNGSGISKNNRVLERHDAVHGYYWRTYDFEEVPQNLIDRGLLAPDRRNVFAYPLGPGERREHVPARRRRGDLQPAERPAGLLHHERRQQPARQGPDGHRHRPEAAGQGGRARRLVHGLPRPRHPRQGRPDARPPGEEPEGGRRRPTPTWPWPSIRRRRSRWPRWTRTRRSSRRPWR